MSLFEPSIHSYGATGAKDYSQDAGKETKLSAGLAKASAGVAATGAVAAVVAPPWSLIVTAAAAATSLGLQVASKVSGRNAKALTGDEAAIAGFIRRAAKMKAAARKKEAEHLLKALKKHEARPKKARAWKVKENVLKMKLAALYAAQHHAGKHPDTPLDPDGPTPAQVEATPDAPLGIPMLGWVIGGVVVAGIGAVVYARSGVRNPIDDGDDAYEKMMGTGKAAKTPRQLFEVEAPKFNETATEKQARIRRDIARLDKIAADEHNAERQRRLTTMRGVQSAHGFSPNARTLLIVGGGVGVVYWMWAAGHLVKTEVQTVVK